MIVPGPGVDVDVDGAARIVGSVSGLEIRKVDNF